MKRVIYITISIIVCLLALYRLRHAEPYEGFNASFDSKADIKKGKIVFIEYGLPSFETYDKRQNIAKKYGFRIDNRGCMSTEVEEKAAEKYNNGVIDYLKRRNGNNWYQQYSKEIDSLNYAVNAEAKRKKILGQSICETNNIDDFDTCFVEGQAIKYRIGMGLNYCEMLLPDFDANSDKVLLDKIVQEIGGIYKADEVTVFKDCKARGIYLQAMVHSNEQRLYLKKNLLGHFKINK